MPPGTLIAGKILQMRSQNNGLRRDYLDDQKPGPTQKLSRKDQQTQIELEILRR